MITYSIYIVDDEKIVREGLGHALMKHYRVKTFSTAEDTFTAMSNCLPDLVLLDIGLPGMDGIACLKEIKRLYPETLVVMITAYEDVETVVSAMKLGAYDYVVKPLHMDTLLETIRNTLETVRMKKEIQSLREKYINENVPCFIGESSEIQTIMKTVKKVAKSSATSVFISGETGTGKELIARVIHYQSPNFKGPFVTLNSAAIPKELIESELFGYEKGAFSGAEVSGKTGLVEKAQGGTLFLDEIGDATMEVQAKLLRFLDGGEFYKVGGTKKLTVKTRIISATNRNLQQMIGEGLFREDLFYRLAVVKIVIPPLSQRPDDIIPIAKYFLDEFSRKFHKSFTSISPEACSALMTHPWNGNIRELRNTIEGAVLIFDGPELTLADIGIADDVNHEAGEKQALAPELASSVRLPMITQSGIDILSVITSIEKHSIVEALKMTKGNESRAAELLKVSRDTFRYRKKKLNIDWQLNP